MWNRMWKRSVRRSSTFAVTCPGQGIVLPGFLMPFQAHARSLAPVLDQIDDALGEKFTANLFNPSADFAQRWLASTANAQPAILLATYVIHHLFRELHGVDLVGRARFVLGHSLGEYLALCLAGVLDVGPAVRLVRKRGQLMEALRLHNCGMVALMIRPLAHDLVVDYFGTAGVVANINSPSQIVLSGQLPHLNKLVDDFKASHPKSILKTVPLPVSIPFHSPMIASIEPELAAQVSASQPTLGLPKTAVVANLSASAAPAASDPRRLVANTIAVNSCPVRWADSIAYCIDHGITDVVNLGPGLVLHALNGKFKVNSHALNSLDSFDLVLDLTRA